MCRFESHKRSSFIGWGTASVRFFEQRSSPFTIHTNIDPFRRTTTLVLLNETHSLKTAMSYKRTNKV